MRSGSGWVVALALAGAPGLAEAGRTQFGWLFGTEVLPERGAEMITWIDEQNDREPNGVHWTRWGWSGLIGVTDQLMLGLPIELLWRESDMMAPSFTWQRFGIEARYRFVSQDPADVLPFAPLGRLAVYRDILARDQVNVEADLVASTTTASGSVMALVDVGFAGNIGEDESHFEVRPGFGLSFKLAGDLRFGGEVYSELSLDDKKQSWVAAGPNAAWSHGRFWLSASFGIGVYQIKTAPRVQWGIMF